MKGEDDQLFDLLIANDADVNATVGETAGRDMSALSYAIESGNRRMQTVLLKKGASPNVHSVNAEPLFHEVVSAGDAETAALLLQHKADPNVSSSDGMTPLKSAIRQESLDLIDLLIENGADPSFATDKADPPLLAAIELGNIAAVNQLIVAGAKLDAAALLAASYERRDDPLMSLLLNAGADPESLFPGTETRVFDLAVQE